MRSLLLLLSYACLAGCSHAPRPAADCRWPAEAPRPLDLANRADRRHLTDDALRAEDLAIRFADSLAAPHSKHFEGFAKYDRMHDECMTALFDTVARLHGVPSSEVRAALTRRPLAPDALVLLGCAFLYVLVARGVARRVARNFPWSGRSDSIVAVVATIAAAAVVSMIAVMIGEWLAISIEMVRVGNAHLSDRTGRVPWTQHRLALFVAGAALFMVVAARGYVREDDHAEAVRRRD